MYLGSSGVTLSSSCESLVWFGGSYNGGLGIPVAALGDSASSPRWRAFRVAAGSRREDEVAREHSTVFGA